jgi:hypothetical protein
VEQARACQGRVRLYQVRLKALTEMFTNYTNRHAPCCFAHPPFDSHRSQRITCVKLRCCLAPRCPILALWIVLQPHLIGKCHSRLPRCRRLLRMLLRCLLR